MDGHVEYFLRCTTIKWGCTNEKFIKDDSHGPPVHRFTWKEHEIIGETLNKSQIKTANFCRLGA